MLFRVVSVAFVKLELEIDSCFLMEQFALSASQLIIISFGNTNSVMESRPYLDPKPQPKPLVKPKAKPKTKSKTWVETRVHT